MVVVTNLKLQLNSILVAKMELPEITYMQVAIMQVRNHSNVPKTTFTKRVANASLSAKPTTVEAVAKVLLSI